MKRKILITGGAGFIGSHLSRNLLLSGNDVTVLDNLYSGNRNNISDLLKYKNFKFIKHDIIKKIDIKTDLIYNLACPASPVHYQKNPIHTFKTSVIGSINMLELAKKYNSKILLASTSEVYGDPLIHPQNEKYLGNVNNIGIRGCYDEGKRAAETIFVDYKKTFNIDIKIARIFNTYGPNMQINDGRVVSNFIIQALKNNDITIYGDGEQTRSFQYIDDLLLGFDKLINKNKNFYGPVNIGNDKEFKIHELAEIIIDLTKSKSNIIYKKLPKDDPKLRKPDISLAKKELEWEPKINIFEGLKNTIRYFKKII